MKTHKTDKHKTSQPMAVSDANYQEQLDWEDYDGVYEWEEWDECWGYATFDCHCPYCQKEMEYDSKNKKQNKLIKIKNVEIIPPDFIINVSKSKSKSKPKSYTIWWYGTSS